MLYLASQSPRRRELLALLGVPFGLLDVDVPEQRLPGEPPETYVSRVAREKAGAGLLKVVGSPGAVVLGADTEVVLDDEVFGKPADADDALRHAGAAVGPHAPRGVDAVAGGRRPRTVGHLHHRRHFRNTHAGAGPGLRRRRRVFRQGRCLRHPGPRGRLRVPPVRKPFGRDGPAAARNRAPAARLRPDRLNRGIGCPKKS